MAWMNYCSLESEFGKCVDESIFIVNSSVLRVEKIFNAKGRQRGPENEISAEGKERVR
jgi:hypothetical protein